MSARLQIVSSGVKEPTVDIVSIPGLPELVPRYRVKDHKKWLSEVLSKYAPSARIMTFPYDFAKTSGRNTSNASWKELTDQVMEFLFALTHRFADTSTPDHRPIVFICYSFGSFILKKALLEASRVSHFHKILERTRGIMFLGCLQDETHPKFKELCLLAASIEFRTVYNKKGSVVESLAHSNHWPSLKQDLGDFRDLHLNIEVHSFYETRESVYYTAKLFQSEKSENVCPEDIATLGWAHEKMIAVDLDHQQLSTFPNRTHPFFESFIRHFVQMTQKHNELHLIQDIAQSDAEADDDTAYVHMLGPTAGELSRLNDHGLVPDADLSSTEARPKLKIPCFVIIPHCANPDFVGREDLLTLMHDHLRPSHVNAERCQRQFVICGLGGMGKTQTALEYVFSHRADYTVALWAHGENTTKLSESYARFIDELGITVAGADQIDALKQWLEQTDEPWLLILDNMDSEDNQELLRRYAPAASSGRGSIIITSRDGTLLNEYHGAKLSPLDEQSAVELLLKLIHIQHSRISTKILEEEKEAAVGIVRRLGFLPLGIQIAAKVIRSEGCRLTDFIIIYDNEELIRESSKNNRHVRTESSTHVHSLATVWNMNYNRLSEDSQNMLNIMSFCDPDRFPLSILSNASDYACTMPFLASEKRVFRCKLGLVRSMLVFENEAVRQELSEAVATGLTLQDEDEYEDVSANQKQRQLSMHRLVQASCLVRMSSDERRLHFQMAISLIRKAWPVPERHLIYDPSLWPTQRSLLPHVQSLVTHHRRSIEEDEPLLDPDEPNKEFARLVYEAAWFCYERGLISQIRPLTEAAKDYCETNPKLPERLLVLADVHGCMGFLCAESKDFKGQYENFQLQWDYVQEAIRTGQLQRPTFYEIFALGRLGNALQGLHRYEEAEKKYRDCLKLWEGLPGDQTLWVSHLATCLWLQGRPEEGLELIKPVIRDRNDATSFRTGLAMYTLGNNEAAIADKLMVDGKADQGSQMFQQAFKTHTQVLNLRQKVLGKNHYRTADARHKCAWYMHRLQDYENAKAFLERALKTYMMDEGIFKNEIARTMYKLGCVLQDMGQSEEGRAKIEEAERLRRQIIPREDWYPASGEEDFDEIVQYWTR